MKFKALTIAAVTSMALAGCASTEGPSFMDQMNALADHVKNNPIYDFDEDAFLTSNHFRDINATTNTDSDFHQKIMLKTYAGVKKSKSSIGFKNGAGYTNIQGNTRMADDKRIKRAANFNLLRNGLMVNGASWNADYELHVTVKGFAADALTRDCNGACATAEEFNTGVRYAVSAELSITDKEGKVIAHEDKVYEGTVRVIPTYDRKPSEKIDLRKADRTTGRNMVLGEITYHNDLYSFSIKDSYKYIEDKAISETIQEFFDSTILKK